MEKYLQKISNASLKFLEPLDSSVTYKTVVKEGIELVGGKYGTLLLEKNGVFEPAYSTLPISLERRKNGFTYRTYREQKTYLIHKKEFGPVYPALENLGITLLIHIPLSYKKTTVGVLIINSEEEINFSDDELGIFQLFGSLATLAIRKMELYNDTKKALDTRDLFISMAAHELRTPLTSVNGYIQLLFNRLSKSPNIEGKWATQLLYESKRLTLLVNELLEVERIKTGDLQYMWAQCSLRIITNRAINNLSFTFPKRKIIFKDLLNQTSDEVIGDFDKILQVITNLLENAAKFSLEDTDIILSLSANQKNQIISIQDFGRGISEEKLPHVFDGYPTDKNAVPQGMGLGLYLVKNIIKLHRGKVQITSKIEKGTTVEIFLPKMK